jgi:KaiC/GvpD/RAD55 family RecA-like ATPase
VNTSDELDSSESPLRLNNLLELIKINYSDVTRLGLDSIVPIAIAYQNDHVFRAELFRFMISLKKMGITVVFTTEISYSSNDTSRFGMEDFLADSVKCFHERGAADKVHKMRGSIRKNRRLRHKLQRSGIYSDAMSSKPEP